MEIKDRLKQVKKVLDISTSRLIDISGVSQQMVSNYLCGKSVIPISLVEKILALYPQLSAEWLIRGTGSMFLSDPANTQSIIAGDNSNNTISGTNSVVTIDSTPAAVHGCSGNAPTTVPLITPSIANRPDFNVVKEYNQNNLILDHVEAINRVGKYSCSFIVPNNAMSPDYKTGDYLALCRQEDTSMSVISGNTYVLDTRLGMILRHVYEHQDQQTHEPHQSLLCKSIHPDRYPDLIIPKSDIYSIFTILGQLRIFL